MIFERKKQLLLLVLFICIITLSVLIVKSNGQFLQEWFYRVNNYMQELMTCCPLKAFVTYMALFLGTVIFAVPVIMPLTFMGGMLFGSLWGGIFALFCVTLGGCASFLMIKKWFLPMMLVRYKDATQELHRLTLSKGLVFGLFLLNLASVVPYVVINTFAAVMNVSVSVVLFTAFFGSAPMLFMYAFLGSHAQSLYQTNSYLFSFIFVFTILLLIGIPSSLVLVRKRNFAESEQV
ncbi:VTT domain-containing protein [bacterium]|nr:MAG: VTT domain-containing protein [bacterium]QQR62397.1 MAG: VTT domain-containing protein [bacterium]